MRRLILPIAFAAVILAGCATVPGPLQGQYSAVSPRDAVAAGQRGLPVRWGGRIVSTDPMAEQTCFEIVSTGLDPTGRPSSPSSDRRRSSRCRCCWNTVCPPSALQFMTIR